MAMISLTSSLPRWRPCPVGGCRGGCECGAGKAIWTAELAEEHVLSFTKAGF